MAGITRAEVERIAALARLELSPDEAAGMAADLDAILHHVKALAEVDTADVPPTAHVLPLPTPLRADRPLPGLSPEAAMRNAPRSAGTAFAVPKVGVDEEEG